MKRILPLILLFLLAGSVSFAQQTAADSPATKEDVQRYLDVMRSRQMMTKMLDAMVTPMHQLVHEQYLKDKDKLPRDFEQRVNKLMDDYLKDLPLDEMLQAMVPAYQKHLTKGDIQALVTFYSTPTGQKLIDELPAMTAEAMQAMMPLLRKHMDALGERVQQEMAQILKDSKGAADQKPQATPN